MSQTYNIYIDESCHLEHDLFPVMCIGYIKINAANYQRHKEEIKAIKLKHKSPTEIKWNRLSWSRLELYKELINYFFHGEMEFRCVLVKNKKKLNHQDFNQGSHDNFYYKLVYYLLRSATNPDSNGYRVIMDIKDTRGKEKLNKISEVFESKYYGNSPFNFFQHIHSSENELIQLTDLFIGAVTYKARGEHLAENASPVKLQLVKYLEEKSGYQLDEGTVPWETKFNIFDLQPRAAQ